MTVRLKYILQATLLASGLVLAGCGGSSDPGPIVDPKDEENTFSHTCADGMVVTGATAAAAQAACPKPPEPTAKLPAALGPTQSASLLTSTAGFTANLRANAVSTIPFNVRPVVKETEENNGKKWTDVLNAVKQRTVATTVGPVGYAVSLNEQIVTNTDSSDAVENAALSLNTGRYYANGDDANNVQFKGIPGRAVCVSTDPTTDCKTGAGGAVNKTKLTGDGWYFVAGSSSDLWIADGANFKEAGSAGYGYWLAPSTSDATVW